MSNSALFLSLGTGNISAYLFPLQIWVKSCSSQNFRISNRNTQLKKPLEEDEIGYCMFHPPQRKNAGLIINWTLVYKALLSSHKRWGRSMVRSSCHCMAKAQTIDKFKEQLWENLSSWRKVLEQKNSWNTLRNYPCGDMVHLIAAEHNLITRPMIFFFLK